MDIMTMLVDEGMRAEEIIHIASMATDEVLSEPLKGALEDDFEYLSELLGFEVVEDMEENSWNIVNSGKRGFLVKMATPVPTFHGDGNGYSFSWGCYTTQWFYSDDIEQTYKDAVVWRTKYMEDQKQKQLAAA